jgi:hypothetical protein
MTIPAALQTKAKAFVGALVTAVGTYLVTALTENQAVTLRGLENAAVLAAAAFLGVHQTVNRKPKGKHAKGQPAHTVVHRRIPVTEVEGKPLGRHIHHDSRSLDYLVPKMSRRDQRKMTSYSWHRDVPIFDQGQLGSCTGNAAVGCIGTDPFYATLPKGTTPNEPLAVSVYSDAEKVDGGAGYPPEDDGSSGLSVAKVLKTRGLIDSYRHITSLAAAKTAITAGPFIVGSYWYDGMDTPDSTGLVTATGTVRGGHEYLCVGYDAAADLWWFDNSWNTTYGDGGTFCYSSATFTALLAQQGDATVFTPIPVAAPTPTPPAADPVDVALAAVFSRVLALKSEPVYLIDEIRAWLAAKGLP